MRINNFLILVFTILILASCKTIPKYNTDKYIAHRDTEYLKAVSTAPLKIPPNLSAQTMKEKYPSPKQTHPASLHALSLMPPGISKNK